MPVCSASSSSSSGLSAGRLSRSVSAGSLASAAAAFQDESKLDWMQREEQFRRRHLLKYTATPLEKHWSFQMPAILKRYGAAVNASARLCEFVQEMKGNETETQFLRVLDNATEAVIDYVKEIHGTPSLPRGISITFARRFWESRINTAIFVPALVHLIIGSSGHNDLNKELARLVFRLYRDLVIARDKWEHLRDVYNGLAIKHGGKHMLYVLFNPNHPMTKDEHKATMELAALVAVSVREHVCRINVISNTIGAECITYLDAQRLASIVDCCDDMAQAMLRGSVPDVTQVRELAHAILHAAEIPSVPPLPASIIQCTRTCDEAPPQPVAARQRASSSAVERVRQIRARTVEATASLNMSASFRVIRRKLSSVAPVSRTVTEVPAAVSLMALEIETAIA